MDIPLEDLLASDDLLFDNKKMNTAPATDKFAATVGEIKGRLEKGTLGGDWGDWDEDEFFKEDEEDAGGAVPSVTGAALKPVVGGDAGVESEKGEDEWGCSYHQQQQQQPLLDPLPPSTTSSKDFSVTISPILLIDLKEKPLDGRLLLLFSVHNNTEPRFEIGLQKKDETGIIYADSQQVFGMDVDGWDGSAVKFHHKDTKKIKGFPLASLSAIPDGTFYIQSFLNVYTTFHRSDNHILKLHADRGEGQHWSTSPGNLYSVPQKVVIRGGKLVEGSLKVELSRVIPEIPQQEFEGKYIRQVKIRSEKLSKFWGTDMYISAMVLLPEGFWDPEHSTAKYPVIVYQGHFTPTWQTPVTFRESPPDYSTCVGYTCTEQEYGHYFYRNWTAKSTEGGSSPY
ncbi:hypothetical protein HDV05_008745, partial [Chytridiales sp. JEL 0842]